MNLGFTLNEGRATFLVLGSCWALVLCGLSLPVLSRFGWTDRHRASVVAIGVAMVFLMGVLIGAAGSAN